MGSKPLLNVIKVGGSILADTQRASSFYRAFNQLDSPKILVHGGGQQANIWLEKLQIKPQKINGRRITDANTLEVIQMVYAGLNKEIVGALNAGGGRAIGLCGGDASLIRAHKRVVKDIDYGFAGDIEAVDANSIRNFLNSSLDLVFSPLTFQADGLLLNTNADTLASRVAVAMSRFYTVILQMVSDVPGVLKDPEVPASRIDELNESTYQVFKMGGIIKGGMIPKIDNAMEGLKQGIHSIYISDRIIYTFDHHVGTKISL